MGDAALPQAGVGLGDGLAVHAQLPFGGLQQAHDDVQQGALAAASGANEAHAAALGDAHVQVPEGPGPVRLVSIAQAAALQHALKGHALARRRGWRGGHALLQQGQGVLQGLIAPAQARQGVVNLLQQGQHALRRNGQRTHHGQGGREPFGLQRQGISQGGNEAHPQRLDRETRRIPCHGGVGLRAAHTLVGLPVLVAVDGLGVVQQHVADATQTLLQGLDPPRGAVRHALAVGTKVCAADPVDAQVDQAEPRERGQGHDRLVQQQRHQDDTQHQDVGHDDEQRTYDAEDHRVDLA